MSDKDVPELSWLRTLTLVPYFAEERQLTEASVDLGIEYRQLREALDFLAQRLQMGPVKIPLPMRRIIAIK